jgi:predicted ATP-dependent protease
VKTREKRAQKSIKRKFEKKVKNFCSVSFFSPKEISVFFFIFYFQFAQIEKVKRKRKIEKFRLFCNFPHIPFRFRHGNLGFGKTEKNRKFHEKLKEKRKEKNNFSDIFFFSQPILIYNFSYTTYCVLLLFCVEYKIK